MILEHCNNSYAYARINQCLVYIFKILISKVGGTPAVIKYLLEKGFIDGDCMTGLFLSYFF